MLLHGISRAFVITGACSGETVPPRHRLEKRSRQTMPNGRGGGPNLLKRRLMNGFSVAFRASRDFCRPRRRRTKLWGVDANRPIG